MKPYKSRVLLASVALASLSLTACQDYDNGFTEKGIAYDNVFRQLLGEIDSKQDWNMAKIYQEYGSGIAESSSSKLTSRADPPTTAYGLSSAFPGFEIPSDWTISRGEQANPTAEEISAANEHWPENALKSDFGTVNGYYISDGTPLEMRVIFHQSSSYDIIGVYDVENPARRLPVVVNEEYNRYNQAMTCTYIYYVTIPAGTKFGFYLERTESRVPNGHTHFSEEKWNRHYRSTYSDQNCADYNVVLSTDGKMVGFEDWHGTDVDYNDVVLSVPNLFKYLVDVDSWILACEDLGNTDDIDFNDVVLKLSHDETTGKLTITPLASGASLASTVYFQAHKGELNEGEEHNLGEIHTLLDGSEAAEGNFINVNSAGTPGAPIEITVGSDYDIAAGFDRGDFWIETVQYDQNGRVSTNIVTSNKATYNSKGGSLTPAMMLLPGNWEWPTERTFIGTAYPSFSDWVGDRSITNWITDKNNESLVKRYEEEVADDPNEEPEDGPTGPTIDEENIYTITSETLGNNGVIDKSKFVSTKRIDITIELANEVATKVYLLANTDYYANVLNNETYNYSANEISTTTTYTITNSEILSKLAGFGSKYDTNNMNANVDNIKSITITNYK